MRNVKPDDKLAASSDGVFVVGLDEFVGNLLVPKLCDLPAKLVIEHVRQPLVENQRQDEVLELPKTLRTLPVVSQPRCEFCAFSLSQLIFPLTTITAEVA